MGLNPVWRKSLVLAALGRGWREGADLAEIEATRRLLIEDMRILEGIAPESGAYLNEVRVLRLFTVPRLVLNPLSRARRHRNTNSTGRNRSSGLTTISSEPSSRSGIRIRCSLCTKASDQTSGTQISSVESETTSNYRTALLRNLGVGCVQSASHFMIHVLYLRLECTDLTLSSVSTCFTGRAQPDPKDETRSVGCPRIRYAVIEGCTRGDVINAQLSSLSLAPSYPVGGSSASAIGVSALGRGPTGGDTRERYSHGSLNEPPIIFSRHTCPHA